LCSVRIFTLQDTDSQGKTATTKQFTATGTEPTERSASEWRGVGAAFRACLYSLDTREQTLQSE